MKIKKKQKMEKRIEIHYLKKVYYEKIKVWNGLYAHTIEGYSICGINRRTFVSNDVFFLS